MKSTWQESEEQKVQWREFQERMRERSNTPANRKARKEGDKRREQTRKTRAAKARDWRAKWHKPRPDITLDEFIRDTVIPLAWRLELMLDEALPYIDQIQDDDIRRAFFRECRSYNQVLRRLCNR